MTATFFGTDADLAQVWCWLSQLPSMRIFEDQSEPDRPNRWFDDWDAAANAINNKYWMLAAWPECVGGKPRLDKISFNPATQRKSGAKGRTALRSPATIKINRNNDQNECLASASIGFWTENGARQRSIYSEEFIDEVDWKVFQSIAKNVERYVAKSAPAKLRSYPVMPDAFEKFRNGQLKLWNWGEECFYPSPIVRLV